MKIRREKGEDSKALLGARTRCSLVSARGKFRIASSEQRAPTRYICHMDIKIRKAVSEDMIFIHHLVKQLAAFEKAPDDVITTSDQYEKDFSDKRFEVIVAENEKEIIGMAFYYFAYSTWKGKFIWLEDFIVLEEYRKHGIGKLLFDSLIDECKKQDVLQLKWQVLDWNTPAIKFYENYSAEFQRGWLTYRLFLNKS